LGKENIVLNRGDGVRMPVRNWLDRGRETKAIIWKNYLKTAKR